MFLFFFRAQILIGCSKSMYKSLSLCLLKRQQVTNSTAESKLLVREPLLLWVRIPFFIFVGKKTPHFVCECQISSGQTPTLVAEPPEFRCKIRFSWLELTYFHRCWSAFHGWNPISSRSSTGFRFQPSLPPGFFLGQTPGVQVRMLRRRLRRGRRPCRWWANRRCWWVAFRIGVEKMGWEGWGWEDFLGGLGWNHMFFGDVFGWIWADFQRSFCGHGWVRGNSDRMFGWFFWKWMIWIDLDWFGWGWLGDVILPDGMLDVFFFCRAGNFDMIKIWMMLGFFSSWRLGLGEFGWLFSFHFLEVILNQDLRSLAHLGTKTRIS